MENTHTHTRLLGKNSTFTSFQADKLGQRQTQASFVSTLTHSHTCMPNLKHQENNLQFKGLTWTKGHILSLSSQRRSSLTPLKRGRTSRWGVLRVKQRPCVTRTILPVCVCVCVCTEGTRGWISSSSVPGLPTSWIISPCQSSFCLPAYWIKYLKSIVCICVSDCVSTLNVHCHVFK